MIAVQFKEEDADQEAGALVAIDEGVVADTTWMPTSEVAPSGHLRDVSQRPNSIRPCESW